LRQLNSCSLMHNMDTPSNANNSSNKLTNSKIKAGIRSKEVILSNSRIAASNSHRGTHSSMAILLSVNNNMDNSSTTSNSYSFSNITTNNYSSSSSSSSRVSRFSTAAVRLLHTSPPTAMGLPCPINNHSSSSSSNSSSRHHLLAVVGSNHSARGSRVDTLRRKQLNV
jgi:hypothetical protein